MKYRSITGAVVEAEPITEIIWDEEANAEYLKLQSGKIVPRPLSHGVRFAVGDYFVELPVATTINKIVDGKRVSHVVSESSETGVIPKKKFSSLYPVLESVLE